MLELTPDDIVEEKKQLGYPAPDGHGFIMSNSEYHSLDAIGSTSLRYLEESSLHFENRELFKMESPSLHLGTAVHTLTLEPEKFKEEFANEPKNAPRNTTIGKAKWADFEENLGDKTPIGEKDLELSERMSLNLRTIMKDYLATGIKERSFFSTYRGMETKCRPDLMFETPNGWIIFDVKTTKDINKMARTIEDYRYDRAMAWYRRVLTDNGYNIIGTVLAFVESAGSSHEVKLRMLQSEDLAKADEEIEELMIKHETFKKTGKVLNMIKPIEIFQWQKSQIDT
jgi:hypothetical protein